MLKIPLIIVVTFLLVWRFGSLFLPPKIVLTFPGKDSQEVALDSKIEIVFDRGVIRSLAGKSFQISPAVPGQVTWEGDQKMTFTPKENFGRGSSYQINFSSLVLSRFLVPLLGNNSFSFTVIGNPRVAVASPQNEAIEDFLPVTAVFDRPMIPLTTATNSGIKQPAFTISPKIDGNGRWLGTTAYQFRPTEPYQKATTYKVTIPAGMLSQDGGTLENYTWQFSSLRPHVEQTSPLDNYPYASPTASVAAFFNQNLNLVSATQSFELLDNQNQKVPGRVQVFGRTLGFYPNSPLQRGQNYRAVAKSGLLGSEGPNGLEYDYSWNFTVAGYPQIISTTPANSSTSVSNQSGIDVQFKTPMDEDTFAKNVTIDPKPDTLPYFSFSSYDNRNTLYVNTYLARSAQYTITFGSNISDQYGVPLGTPYTLKFTTAPYDPGISLVPFGTYFAAFNQDIIPRVVAQVTNANKVDYNLYRLQREDFLDLYRRRYTDVCGSDVNSSNCRNWKDFNLSKLAKIRSWSETYTGTINVPVQVVTKVTADGTSKLSPGLYFLEAKIPTASDVMVMIVSRETVTVKRSDKQIFTWIVNQSTGETISKAKIEVVDPSGSVLASGETNNDGVFMRDLDLWQKNNLLVFGQKDDDVVVASNNWSQGINRYDFGLPSYYNSNEQKDYQTKEAYKLFLTLDRPIFRPGQKIYFKGLIRKDNDGAYENLPPGTEITVQITDARNREVYKQNLPINSFGSFANEFLLSQEASLGDYTLKAQYSGNTITQSFQVEEYRRPDLLITATPNKAYYLPGQNVQVGINAAYYFGAPVTGVPTQWQVQTQDYSFTWDKDPRFEFGNPEDYWARWWSFPTSSAQSKITSGKGQTDAKGNLNVSFTPNMGKYKTSQKMLVEATVSDLSNQSVGTTSEFVVHLGGIYAGLRPVSYGNQTGQETKVEIVTVSPAGTEVPKTTVTIDFYKRTWDTVREQNPDDGRFYYVSKPKDSLVSTTPVTTDDQARTFASFTPSEGGTYRVVATATDASGNKNISSSYLWVSGYGFSTNRENNDRILVVTDKRDYLVGEKASVFIASPLASGSAKTLLTVERGSVLDYKIVDTSDTSNNFPIDINPKFSPNAYIGAVLVKGGKELKNPPEFKIGYAEIKVTDKKQQIAIEIQTDKKKYKPGETMTASITTRDLLGHPVAAEVAVGLVDKAVWDLSRVELPNIYKFFYQPRNLEVDTADLLTISMDRINANTNLGAKGGSGGGGSGGPNTTRKDFPATAYWNPSLLTGNDGKATIQVKLPDNLTTWRLAAIADSSEAAFGSSVNEFIVSRDVLIRPMLPRFLSVGDQAKLGAIVVNTSGADEDVTVIAESSGVTISTIKAQGTRLADGAQAKFLWTTETESTDSAKIKFTVYGHDGQARDSLETTLPVKPYVTAQTVATAGQAKDTAQENITLPKDVVANATEATLTITPTLGAGSIESLSYLTSYPYYCAEQTTSRFLPAVYVNRLFKQNKIDGVGNVSQASLPGTINDGLQRLNNTQHPDGGWGWWITGDSEPFLTAYAYSALAEAKKDGWPVASQTLERAEIYLTKALSQVDYRKNLETEAYILYVLRDKNKSLSPYVFLLFDRRFGLSVEARAYLAMAAKATSGNGGKADRIYQEVLSLVKKTGTTSHWEEQGRSYDLLGSNTTTTAAVLEMMLVFDKNNPLVAETVRYLMNSRNEEHWQSTRDTTAATVAIVKQIMAAGSGTTEENFRVDLDGKTLHEGKFTKQDLLAITKLALPVSDSKLQITKSGSGQLYYNLNLKYFLPFTEVKPLEQGLVVVREFVDKDGLILPPGKITEGQEVWVRLIIVAPESRQFVTVEDVLPAGLESVNESLKNVVGLSSAPPKPKDANTLLGYFDHQEYHDDRTTLFARYLPAGVYEITYRVRATTPGKYHYPPAQAYQMYSPDVSGHSDGGWLEVISSD